MEKILARSELFRDMSAGSLGELARRGNTRSVIKGGVIFLEGEPGKYFFIMLEGRVRLEKTTHDGNSVTLKILSPYEAFAETILFEDNRYPASAYAIEDSKVFVISKIAFLGFLDEKEFRNEFISMLMKKQRYLAKRILYLTSYDVEERFFRFLVEQYGRKDRYSIDISKKDIALSIGTIPETFSRLLSRLKASGTVKWKDGTLEVDWEKALP